MPTSVANLTSKTTRLLNASARASAPVHPLTHHEILGLIEPFARAGLRVDLERSDRLGRCLVFKTVQHGGVVEPWAGLCEDVRLENPAPDIYRLIRTVTLPDGMQANLQSDGASPGDLLAGIQSVPLSQHFRSASGAVIALSYCLAPASTELDAAGGGAQARLLLTHAAARVFGLALHLKDATVSGYPADIEIVPDDRFAFDFPEDLLAVLGRGWGLLHRYRAGWRAQIDARGTGPARSRHLETMFDQTVGHLVATLAEPPARFHETRRRARWGVALRRGAPLIVYVALLFCVAGISHVKIANTPLVRHVLWFCLTVLTVGALTMRNRPRLEFPKLPRRLRPTAWRSNG